MCSVYALSTKLPLALVSLILSSRTLMMISLARLMLGEQAGPALWVATLIRFAGVALAVSPTLAVPDQLSALAAMVAAGELRADALERADQILGMTAMVAASITSADSQLAVRRLTLTTPSTVTVAVYALLSTIQLAVPAALVWVPPSLTEASDLLGIGLLGMAALFCTAQAYRFAPATIVAPLTFLEIPLAAALDYGLWGKVSTWQTMVGAVMIVGATYCVTALERRR